MVKHKQINEQINEQLFDLYCKVVEKYNKNMFIKDSINSDINYDSCIRPLEVTLRKEG